MGLYRDGSLYASDHWNGGGILYDRFTIPNNVSTTQSHTWTVVVTATDGVGNQTTASQSVTQLADVPPVISSIYLSPSPLSPVGGSLEVSPAITAGNSGIATTAYGNYVVFASLYEDGKLYVNSQYLNGGGGWPYDTKFTIPNNVSTTQSHTWTVVVTATDGVGNQTTASQSVTQLADVPPVISSTTISPTILLKNGDTLIAQATVLPGNPQSAPVKAVTAEIDKDGKPYLTNVALGSINAVYKGIFSIPANTDPLNGHVWTVILTAMDTLGNSSQTTLGPSVQLSGDQLTIAYAALTPAALPASGGALIVDALGADPFKIASITTTIYKDSQFYTSDSTNLPLSDLMNYEGRFQIAANPDTRSHNWSAVVTFTAGNGEIVSRSLGPSVQAASPLATVTGRIALEGVGDFSAISPNVPPGLFHIAFRSPGATTEFYGADVSLVPVGAGSPFGAFQISGVPNGIYDVAIKGAKNLRIVLWRLSVSGKTILPDAALPACDANNDNSVDSTDFGILIGAFNTDSRIAGSGYDPAADFNFDGVVDSTDFGLLIGDFNNQGAL